MNVRWFAGGRDLSKGAFKALRKTIDYTEYGGAPLLGVRGVCVIAHGRSTPRREKRHPRSPRDSPARA